MLSNEHPLSPYIPLVDFIAGIVGPYCEVVLHDIANVEKSIIAIKNGHISGRKQGGPLTDLGLKLLKEKAYEKTHYLMNYSSKNKDGKPLRSSTYFIKDNSDKLIGMLCINIELDAPLQAKKFIESFIKGNYNHDADTPSREKEPEEFHPENLTTSIDELMFIIIENTINNLALPPERLSPDEKQDVIKELNDKGVFLLKGAIAEVAEHLKVSENTVYRYLNKIN